MNSDYYCESTLTLYGRTEYFETYDDAYGMRSEIEVRCQLEEYHNGPHSFAARRNDDKAGRYVIQWEGDDNLGTLDVKPAEEANDEQ